MPILTRPFDDAIADVLNVVGQLPINHRRDHGRLYSAMELLGLANDRLVAGTAGGNKRHEEETGEEDSLNVGHHCHVFLSGRPGSDFKQHLYR